jgi:hypothetical protein
VIILNLVQVTCMTETAIYWPLRQYNLHLCIQCSSSISNKLTPTTAFNYPFKQDEARYEYSNHKHMVNKFYDAPPPPHHFMLGCKCNLVRLHALRHTTSGRHPAISRPHVTLNLFQVFCASCTSLRFKCALAPYRNPLE